MEQQNYQSADGSVALTLTNYTDASGAFTQRYFLAGGSTSFVREFTVPWSNFNNAIQQFMSVDNIPADRLALQFIHRYNPATHSWYLCMSGGMLSAFPVGRVGGNDLYDVTPGTIRFDLCNNTVTPSAFTGTYDPAYFNSFFYKEDNGSLIPLAADVNHTKFVGAVTMPWLAEVSRLVTDNGVNPGTQTVQFKFTCCSFYYQQPNDLANIAWPHMVGISLVVNGVNCIDNIDYKEKMFKMKAADMATNCPPFANQYVLPGTLVGSGDGDGCGHGHGNGHGHNDDDDHGNGHGHDGHGHGHHDHEHDGDHDGHGHHHHKH